MTCEFEGSAAFEDTPCTILGRVAALNGGGSASPVESEGTLVVQSDITSISVKVYSSLNVLINTYTPAASNVIYNTLQTTGVFSKLDQGGNFLYTIPATGFPEGDTTVRVEVTITLNSGDLVRGLWKIPVIALLQS